MGNIFEYRLWGKEWDRKYDSRICDDTRFCRLKHTTVKERLDSDN